MRRFIFWATLASGAVAAYLMYRRGQPIFDIAEKTVLNPVGSLVHELRTAS
jgi:hypothetical protein